MNNNYGHLAALYLHAWSYTGPLPHTMADFWRLVWQEKPPIIVMVTNLKEGNRIKCQQYWPESGRCQIGPFEVSITDHQVYADYTVRKLIVTVREYMCYSIAVMHQCTSHPHTSTYSYPAALSVH